MRNVTFHEVCKIFDILEKTSSRNEMTEKLSNFYKTLNSTDAQILSYLIQGRVAPFFVNSEFNYSEKSFLTLLKNISEVGNISEDIHEKRKELGDIGDTLEYITSKLGYSGEGLSLQEMYDIFWRIVNTTGNGSIEKKNSLITNSLKQISPLESKYFGRIVCGSLRFGLNVKTLLDVFSFVIQGDKGIKEELERAYGAYADIGYICNLVIGKDKKEVLDNLTSVKVQPGIPVMPRLVERVSKFEEVFERLGESILVQSKYDGLRCQIHKFNKNIFLNKETIWLEYLKKEDNGSLFETKDDISEVKLFTRNLEDVTEMFPEIVEAAKAVNKESFILDSEALGWNPKVGKFMTFQETMQRRRKYGVKSMKEDMPVKAMVFDILYLEGKSLLDLDTEKRIEILEDIDLKGSIEKDRTVEVNNLDNLYEVFNKAINFGHEGIIVKNKIGKYLPGVRNYDWIKLKRSMESNLVDSIDLVAVGYSQGSGRRSGFGIGAVLGAIYNEEKDTFEAICNVGTGFSDEQLKNISKSFEKDILEKKPKNINVEKGLEPDVWVEPRVVFTVEADEITRKKDSKLLSLRFPRLIEWDRDKSIVEATSVEELENMFLSSKMVAKR